MSFYLGKYEVNGIFNLTMMLSHSATPQANSKIHLNFEKGILHKHGCDASYEREIL